VWGSSRGHVEVGFLPLLPKSEVGGQVEGPVGDARIVSVLKLQPEIETSKI
jgi:hypothetical protein